jgi:hypothetical protein
MPDFGDLEEDAESHSKDVDEGIGKADQEAGKETGGHDDGMIDKGSAEVEKELADNAGDGKPAGQ